MTRDLSDPYATLADLKDRLRILQNVPQGVGGVGVENVQFITRTDYDALGTKKATTLYCIDESA